MTEADLPHGFRIRRVSWGGSGHGDELFALALEKWSTWTEKVGIFRRKEARSGWVLVERGDPFDSDSANRTVLTATALMLTKKDN